MAARLLVQVGGATSFGGATRSFARAGGFAQDDMRRTTPSAFCIKRPSFTQLASSLLKLSFFSVILRGAERCRRISGAPEDRALLQHRNATTRGAASLFSSVVDFRVVVRRRRPERSTPYQSKKPIIPVPRRKIRALRKTDQLKLRHTPALALVQG